MIEELPFEPPKIMDEDIRRASRLLDLPDDAFYGEDGTDPRQEVLKSMEPLDVAACPGSGKTTLLVAKLAILAEKWRYRTTGICVVSHTNAARNEIETRLGNTAAGRRLLSYPHYIGTIHGFINDFLATPWLRSQGYVIKMIDTDTCLRRRWTALPFSTRSALEKNHCNRSILSAKSPRFDVGEVRWGKKGRLATDTDTYRCLRNTCRLSIERGYFCHEEMFMWAEDLLDRRPDITKVLRGRFPLLFIDEAQDNSEEQSRMLYRIFMKGKEEVIRQRFGDENQAIFDSMNGVEATTDKFPDSAIKKDLPNSHRFGQKIADLANPLGLTPYACGLRGQGPRKCLESGLLECRHTIFLFDGQSAEKVIDAYAELLLQSFSESELRDGTFTAVGQIHRPPEKEEEHKFPHHIGNYWTDYDPELTSRDSKPQTFVQYVFAGIAGAEATWKTNPCVEKIAEGILRLAAIEEKKTYRHHRQNHRSVLEVLQRCAETRRRYEDMIYRFAVMRERPTKETWNDHWAGVVREIAEAIAGFPLATSEADSFTAWKEASIVSERPQDGRRNRGNIYPFPRDDPKVHIRVGSIHSVKGETHTATLVLDTFWKDNKGRHNLELLSQWLCDDNCGQPRIGAHQQYRLRLHYVAMTRPTHLLCLAMKRSIFRDERGDLDPEAIRKMERHGWHVVEIPEDTLPRSVLPDSYVKGENSHGSL